jgi:hypothetical protein
VLPAVTSRRETRAALSADGAETLTTSPFGSKCPSACTPFDSKPGLAASEGDKDWVEEG